MPGAVRLRLICAAERLIAEGGSSVPMSSVIAAADVGNNSAVTYHFGGREGLIAAVFENRLDALEAFRAAHLAERGRQDVPADLHGVLGLLVWSLMVSPYADGSQHHARFMEKVRDRPELFGSVAGGRWPVTARAAEVLNDLVGAAVGAEHSPEAAALATRRRAAMASTLFALLSDAERNQTHLLPIGQRRAVAADIVAMLVGLVRAPVPVDQTVPGGR